MQYNNRKKDIIYPIALAVVLGAGIWLGLFINQKPERSSLTVYPRADKLSSILSYIENQYVDTVSMENLVESTIPTMLKHLDPHSVYIPASDLQTVNEPLDGGFDGIGVTFNMPNDTVVIISTIVGGPSERVGLQPGDRIITINDSLVAGVSFNQNNIVTMLKGPTGTKVTVGILRQGLNEIVNFEITRDKIPIYSVDVSFMLNQEVGYIKISRFARTTYSEFIEAIDKLQEQGMKKIIIDLRNNNGGYLDAATNIANEFLPEGKLIVYTQGKARPRQNVYSNARGRCIDTPVAIIIDEFSASASEILAGALQDNDRGIVTGRRSFGKGLVQEQVLFSDGSALRLTIARYYTPTGRSIQKPYEPGSDEYFYDISNRYLHGEFQERDSIYLADSLKFTTPAGRTVYGGGGIMPDFFIPLDTTGATTYLNQVARRNLIYRFAFSFADRHRKNMAEMKSHIEIENYLAGKNILDLFVDYARQRNVEPNYADIEKSKLIIETQIKAYVARILIDNQGFFPIYTKIDNTLLKTIDILEKEDLTHLFSSANDRPKSLMEIQLAMAKNQVTKDIIALGA
ncbi:S41 family peptidase [Perlabentimonas gracilis]|uniref:S41 family peptidase n=1 Tax=Perlabentimonas gracilis TaxID=2715279 RepID=UPI0014079D92|nr:S41 family peptidase [Perlabentimonas gracilis]NHB67628.1 S41 family peptidase [Perlabentimonas gracilis]